MAKKTCAKCGRTKELTMFYTYKNGLKALLCKECTLMHVNIWEPDTFVWLLEKYDVPWLPWLWDSLREKAYAKDPSKKNNTTVFGKYLSKMKLKQFKESGWADTLRLTELHLKLMAAKAEENKTLQEMYADQFERGLITEAQYRTLVKALIQRLRDKPVAANYNPIGKDNFYNEKNYMPLEEVPNLADDLTDEDKKYLVMKWGRLYTPQEWVLLETFYTKMTDSFDIQDADTESTLILICKNNLKMNQSIDQGDLEGYQKLARVSDTLRKSAKFTAAQNKLKSSLFMDSVGLLVDYCLKHKGEIPQFNMQYDLDIIDTIIKDLKLYTRSLVFEDPALKREIEDYLKKLKNNEQQKHDRQEAKEKGLDYVEITDLDIQVYNQLIQNQKEQDMKGVLDYESTNTPLD